MTIIDFIELIIIDNVKKLDLTGKAVQRRKSYFSPKVTDNYLHISHTIYRPSQNDEIETF